MSETLDESFGEAFINGRHWIAGRLLRPFCAWHLVLLQALQSPYLKAKPDGPPIAVTSHDLLTTVGICSLRFGKNNVRRPRNPISWLSCRSETAFEKTNDRLLEYIGDYLQKPDFTVHVAEDQEGPKRGQPPEIFQAVCDVIRYTGWYEAKVWEMPIGSLYWYQSVALKEKYDVDFIDEEEKKFQDALEKHLAEKKQANGS